MNWLKNFLKWLKERAMSAGSKSFGAFVVTVFSFALVAWSLYYVLSEVGTAPTPSTETVPGVDAFKNAKDIFTVVFPLATGAAGFWFGSDGKAKAQEQATTAQAEASTAKAAVIDSQSKVHAAERQKDAVLKAAQDGKALLDKAKQDFPESFTDN